MHVKNRFMKLEFQKTQYSAQLKLNVIQRMWFLTINKQVFHVPISVIYAADMTYVELPNGKDLCRM